MNWITENQNKIDMRSLYGIDPTNLSKDNITEILRNHKNTKVKAQRLGQQRKQFFER